MSGYLRSGRRSKAASPKAIDSSDRTDARTSRVMALHAFTLDVTLPLGWISVSQGAGPDGPPPLQRPTQGAALG